MAQRGRPRKLPEEKVVRPSKMIWLPEKTASKLEVAAKNLGVSMRQALELVLRNHKRGRVGLFRKDKLPAMRGVGLNSFAEIELKKLRACYGGTADEIISYALDHMNDDEGDLKNE